MTSIRRYRLPLTLLWLTVLWLLLWADLSLANVATGLIVGAVLLAAAGARPVRRDDDTPVVSLVASLWFVIWVLGKLVQANLVLAWEILTPRNRIRTGVVAVPLRTESPTVSMIVATVITLTPGTLTIEVAGSPPVLYVHVLHLHDLDRVRADLLAIEALSVRAFGSRRARDQLRREAER